MSSIRVLCSPERAAKYVLRGVQANMSVIFAPPAVRRLWRLWRFLQGVLEAMASRRFECERQMWQ